MGTLGVNGLICYPRQSCKPETMEPHKYKGTSQSCLPFQDVTAMQGDFRKHVNCYAAMARSL